MSNMDDDRLSKLPDAVLATILDLSQLEAKVIVQTCLLSKRLRNVWTLVRHLDFTDNGYQPFRDNDKFKNFVDTFLSLRDPATDVQCLRIRHTKAPCILRCIRYALNRNPKKLKIELLGEDPIELPKSLFTCNSLESLYLQVMNRETRIVPNKVSLSKLKEFNLIGPLLRGECIDKIISGCPSLDNLALSFCQIILKKNISFKTLKQLCIQESGFRIEKYNATCPSLSISAPQLTNLEFKGYVPCGSIKLKDMSKVTEAKLWPSYECELLCALSGVEKLEIDTWRPKHFKKKVEGEIGRCSTFHNMKNLTFGGACMHCNYGVLCAFLKHCPNLEHLTLVHMDFMDHYCEDEDWEEDERFNCKEGERFNCHQLRSVHVECRSLHDAGVDQLVKLLHQSTSHLNQVRILLRRQDDY